MKSATLSLLLICCLTTPLARAAAAYQVELIVFRQTTPSSTEVWPPISVAELPMTAAAMLLEPAPVNTAATTPATIDVTRFSLLDPAAYQLQGTWDALARSNRYEPLLHIAWQQPGLDEPDVKPVRIQMGQPLTAEQPGTPVAVFADPYRTPATTADEKAEPAPVWYSPLDGSATLTVNFYMFLQLDLLFTPTPPVATALLTGDPAVSAETDQAVLAALARGELTLEQAQAMRTPAATLPADTAAPVSGINGFRLHESRRLKLNEINYFDNPLFGVIAQVRPVELPEPTDQIQN